VIRSLSLAAGLAALLCASTARADDARLWRLGEHFYDAGQYYRAIGAFEELALFSDDAELVGRARLRIAMSYHHGLQIDQAVAAYDALLTGPLARDDERAGWVRLLRVLVRSEGVWRELRLVPVDDLRADLAPLEGHEGAAYQVQAGYHLARFELARGDRGAARAVLARSEARCQARPVADCAVLARLAGPLAWAPPDERSPALGLALSLLVPGAGSLYAGSSFDALYYFGLTAGTGLLAWDVYAEERGAADQKTSFYVLAGVAATFYLSSAVQGWMGVARQNEVDAYEHRRRVLRATELPLPLEEIP
jgi:hypothetical protein